MREDKNENRWDKLLQIHTMGRDDSRSDLYRYPYEPTPYCVLERMANTGMIRKGNTLLDYGCGKGRVDFFLSAQTRCRSIGVEYDDRIYAKAVENKKAAASGARTEFVLESAENFPVPAEVDRVYFFNPFSLEILRKAMARLLESYYENPAVFLLPVGCLYLVSDDGAGTGISRRDRLYGSVSGRGQPGAGCDFYDSRVRGIFL
mgnify:CR=1 FL=1